MAWNPRMQAVWARRRELAVTMGVDESLLATVDALMADDVRAARSPDSWFHETVTAIRRVDDAMFERFGDGPVPAAPFLEYRRDVDAKLRKRYDRLDAEMRTAPVLICEGYILTCMVGAKDQLSDLTSDIPTWSKALGEAAIVASASSDPEAQARALAQSIFDLAEVVYKPLLLTVYRLTLRKYGKASPKKEPRMLGELAAALRTMWRADPNHLASIDPLIDDDALFVRKGVAHKSLRFDPIKKKLVITDGPTTREFTIDELKAILGGFYKRIRPMWLALAKVSGKIEEEKVALGIAAPAPSPP